LIWHDEGTFVIIGVGIDVVDVARFGQSLARTPRLLERLFTESERSLGLNSLSARFAAKEALAKALGAPVGLHWTHASVENGDNGRPHLKIWGTVEACATALGVRQLHLSISHDAGIASAVVIAEG
jgi:holo-[acyl-carrier protein] synthase